MALNYKEVVQISWDQFVVLPDINNETVAKPAGRWTMKMVILEWYAPSQIQSVLDMEFPAGEGWIYDMPQPSKPQEELDMLNLTVIGKKRIAN